jgi:3-deoxy-manno-octulosonate cytidylyltransferase (CMP-KDO synthetase)
MKIIGVIPARYASTRFPGKPLADIHGKPMIWWVYQQAKKVSELEDVIVATDDRRIFDAVNEFDGKVLMTSCEHKTHLARLYEVSQKIDSDLYVCICGDEPLIKPETISLVIPREPYSKDKFVMQTLIREFNDPVEALDPANIKVVTNKNNECLLLTRSQVPFPYKSIDFKFKKLVGIECYSHSALEYFHEQAIGTLEQIEDIVLLRYVENRKPIRLIMSNAYQLGVDTPKDLVRVKKILSRMDD